MINHDYNQEQIETLPKPIDKYKKVKAKSIEGLKLSACNSDTRVFRSYTNN